MKETKTSQETEYEKVKDSPIVKRFEKEFGFKMPDKPLKHPKAATGL